MKKVKTLILLLVFGICLYILFFQPEWLGLVVLNKPLFPLGSLVSWLLIASFTFLVYFIFPENIKNSFDMFLKFVSKLFLFFACGWGLISFFLCGNWSFNFENKTGFFAWIFLTALILIVPLILGVVFLIRKLLFKQSPEN